MEGVLSKEYTLNCIFVNVPVVMAACSSDSEKKKSWMLDNKKQSMREDKWENNKNVYTKMFIQKA